MVAKEKGLDKLCAGIFGTDGEESILILVDFLNATLKRAEKEKIVDVIQKQRMPARENEGEIIELRTNTLAGEQLDIVIQINNRKSSLRKSFYYWNEFYNRKHIEDHLLDVSKWILLSITDFTLLPQTKEYHSVFKLCETDNPLLEIGEIELHYLELGKYKSEKNIAQMCSEEDWLSFLLWINECKENELAELAKKSLALELAVDSCKRVSAQEEDDLFEQETENGFVAQGKRRFFKLPKQETAEERYETQRNAIEKAYRKGIFF